MCGLVFVLAAIFIECVRFVYQFFYVLNDLAEGSFSSPIFPYCTNSSIKKTPANSLPKKIFFTSDLLKPNFTFAKKKGEDFLFTQKLFLLP